MHPDTINYYFINLKTIQLKVIEVTCFIWFILFYRSSLIKQIFILATKPYTLKKGRNSRKTFGFSRNLL